MTSLLSINAGSSSLSFALFEGDAPGPSISGGVDLNADNSVHYGPPGAASERLDVADVTDFPAVIRAVLDMVGSNVIVVHRVVHGGETDAAAAWLDEAEVARLSALAPLAPLHQPLNLDPARALAEDHPGLRQIAAFDTAFHRTLPEVARRLPVAPEGPFRGLRRYGFHGFSHAWVARCLKGEAPECRRLVSLHLSGGASACAIEDGRSIDTTMGATPLDGLMMSGRSGAVDPGALLYALDSGTSRAALSDLLWHRSGLKGVSGLSGDLRDLLASGEPDAAAAVDLFCHRAAKAVAEMTVSLGGLDALVFTGGAGAAQPAIRGRIVEHLGWMGLSIDTGANGRDAADIAAPESAAAIRVVPPEEERMMILAARALLKETRG